jgi:glycosyltransferase involved in cell wall biosynthesis
MLKFSIVIPTYRRAEFLYECLNSIAWDHPSLHEVIVISDGAPDLDTVSIVRAFVGVVFLSISHAGPSAARNAGINSASGDYIVFLDDDDLLLPWSLDVFCDAVAKYSPPIIFSKPYIFESVADILAPNSTPNFSLFSDYYTSCDEWRWWGASSFVLRSDLCKANLFREELFLGEDADLIMRIGCNHRVLQIQAPPTFCYRKSIHSITTCATSSLSFFFASVLLDTEANSAYPGGSARSFQRIDIISRHVRPIILSLAKSFHPLQSAILFYKAFPLLLLRKRFAFILLFFANLIYGSIGWLFRSIKTRSFFSRSSMGL